MEQRAEQLRLHAARGDGIARVFTLRKCESQVEGSEPTRNRPLQQANRFAEQRNKFERVVEQL